MALATDNQLFIGPSFHSQWAYDFLAGDKCYSRFFRLVPFGDAY